jgi:hypothetical protein
MEKFQLFINSIDWVFAGVILVGGWFWGKLYFKLSQNAALNFLGFATIFGIIYLLIRHFMGELKRADAANLFLTYLFVTSFYELLGKHLFELIENKFGKKKEDG